MNLEGRPATPSDSDWLRYESVLGRFEAAWRNDEEPRIADHLTESNDADRDYLRRELVKLDLEYRWRRGGRPRIEDYLQQFSELPTSDALNELLAVECRVRKSLGDGSTRAELQARFPNHRLSREMAALLAAPANEQPPRAPSDDAPAERLCPDSSSTPRRNQPQGASPRFVRSNDLAKRGPPVLESVPRRIGHYELRERVGRGGFALVYRAWDAQLQRDVAIKIPRDEFAEVDELIARVRREARSAAQLRHPAIVPIYEVGEDGGRIFIVYQFVRGPTLAKLLKETQPSPRQAAAWLMQIAEALDYSHRTGIVHRDVKPANILMDHGEQPMIGDFGLALHGDSGMTLTHEGDILGTPAYMSPEQARGDGHLADARSDVYGLGVILYEILSGQPPFQGSTASILHQVLHSEPPAPSSRRAQADADLETIALKAMAKEPSRRYSSAGMLADDLRRYLNREPIRARRIGPLTRCVLWCRRNPALATVISIAILIAVIGFWRVVRERDRYRLERAQAIANSYHALVGQARAIRLARASGFRTEAWARLQQALQLDTPERDELALRIEAAACMGDFVGIAPATSKDPQEGRRYMVALGMHPDGHHAAIGIYDGTVLVRNLETGNDMTTLRGHQSGVYAATFLSGGRSLITADDRGTVKMWKLKEPDVRTMPALSDWTCVQTVETKASAQPGHVGAITLAVTPDQQSVLVCPKGTTQVFRWNISDGRGSLGLRPGEAGAVTTRDGVPSYSDTDQAGKQFNCIALSPNGKLLAVAYQLGAEHGLELRERESDTVLHRVTTNLGAIQAIAFNNAGSQLAVACDEGVLVYETEALRRFLFVRLDGPLSVAFSPDDRHLAIPSQYFDIVKLWDLTTNQEIAALHHPSEAHTVAFSADGNSLVAEAANDLCTWKLRGAGDKLVFGGQEGGINAIAFRSDGKLLASAGSDRMVRLWDSHSTKLLGTIAASDASVNRLAFHPTRQILATGDAHGIIRIWEVSSLEAAHLLTTLQSATGNAVQSMAFSPDGIWFAAGTETHGLLWRLECSPANPLSQTRNDSQSQLVFVPSDIGVAQRTYFVTFSPDSQLLLLRLDNFIVKVRALTESADWDLPKIDVGPQDGIAVLQDNRHFLSIAFNKVAQIWDLRSGKLARSFGNVNYQQQGNFFLGRSVLLNPKGSVFAVQSFTMTLWDLNSGNLLLALPKERSTPNCSAWSPDGRSLAIGSADGGLVLWNLEQVHKQLSRIGLGW